MWGNAQPLNQLGQFVVVSSIKCLVVWDNQMTPSNCIARRHHQHLPFFFLFLVLIRWAFVIRLRSFFAGRSWGSRLFRHTWWGLDLLGFDRWGCSRWNSGLWLGLNLSFQVGNPFQQSSHSSWVQAFDRWNRGCLRHFGMAKAWRWSRLFTITITFKGQGSGGVGGGAGVESVFKTFFSGETFSVTGRSGRFKGLGSEATSLTSTSLLPSESPDWFGMLVGPVGSW